MQIGPDRTWDSVSRQYWAQQDMGLGVSDKKTDLARQEMGPGVSKKTYWAREGMGFGVSKEHVGPDKTLDWVSRKDIMIWAMNRVPVARNGLILIQNEARSLQEAF